LSLWHDLVQAIAQSFTVLAGLVGAPRLVGVFVLTFAVRVAMIPVMIPMAIRTRERLKVLRTIRPEIKALDERYKDEPGLLSKKIKAVHEEAGISVIDWSGLVLAFVQLPILIAFFQAVLLSFDQTALSVGGGTLGATAAGLAVWSAKTSGQSDGAPWVLWMSAVLPLAISLWLGAGIATYLAAFYGASSIQGVMMVRRARSEAAAGH
jgi:hypothetical protein